MSRPPIWNPAKIRELIALAQTSGESRAKLASEEDASRFRFAVYHFRRNNDMPGPDISVRLDNSDVVLSRLVQPLLTIEASEKH